MKTKLIIVYFIFSCSLCIGQRKEYKEAVKTGTIEAYEAFIKEFPSGKYFEKAIVELEELINIRLARVKEEQLSKKRKERDEHTISLIKEYKIGLTEFKKVVKDFSEFLYSNKVIGLEMPPGNLHIVGYKSRKGYYDDNSAKQAANEMNKNLMKRLSTGIISVHTSGSGELIFGYRNHSNYKIITKYCRLEFNNGLLSKKTMY